MADRDVCSTTMNAHLDVFSGMQAQEPYFQSRPFTENVNLQIENVYDHQQMMHMMPSETFSDSNFGCPTSSQWSNGYLPSNTDIYGTSLVSRTPSDPFNLPSPVDYNSYSPPQSHSSSSSCYSSPTRMDLSSSFSPESYHYQHCNLQHCFCLSHCSDMQEGMATTEYAPYGSSDCLFSYNDDSYFRRDILNPEMCYL
ncbi:colorectal cancer associated 2 isoform X2 [Danio rerio]